MARILYGVHGTGHGHAVRALTVARHYPQHQFLFISHSHGAELLRREYPLVECYNPETPVVAHRVNAPAALLSVLRTWARQPALTRMLLREIERFQPDAALTDYEYFVPRACRVAGLPCLSVDHQHVITCSHLDVPARQFHSYLATSVAIRGLFSAASAYMAISFFQPPLRPGMNARIVPPLLRDNLFRLTPSDGDHVLAYHAYATSPGFYNFLRAIPRSVKVYGSHRTGSDGNLQFRPRSEDGLLADLASCAYMISSSGHTLLSEALYFGKPSLVIPVSGAFEEFINGHYVETLGYGRCHEGVTPPVSLIPEIESNLDRYRQNIRAKNFCGNAEVFALLDAFIEMKQIPCAS
jgi:uncharacterized protein (TIGR00661 family)